MNKNIQPLSAANIHRRTSAAAANPLPRFEKILKPLDDLISQFLDLPLRPSLDPKHVLSGNFAPVGELLPTQCSTVEGSLPSCLEGGAYIRNGPNPQFIPNGPYHLFDGDGMLHVVKFSRGKTVFCSRYVETYKYLVERELGYPIFISPLSSFNGVMASLTRCALTWARILTKCFNPAMNGLGTANTSVALLGEKLFALCESDLPYEVKLTSGGDVKTISRRDFDMKNDPFLRMTAHPKTDIIKGETFAFRCSLVSPFLVFFKIDSNGTKGRDIPILSMRRPPSFVHDFALTENYIVFEETQFVVDVVGMIRGKSPPLMVDEKRLPRLGILPRNAEDESELKWVDVPGLNMMHLVNAWEEDDGRKIVMVAPNVKLEEGSGLESIDSLHSVLEKITIDVKERSVRRDALSTKNVDFATVSPRRYGRKSRYVYAAISSPTPKVSGVMKIDTSLNCTVASRSYGPGFYGGEPFFVANDEKEEEEEDDGYLVTYVHDENKQESYFLVMNAKSIALDIVARVRLPQRVPYGFHGLFVKAGM